MADDKLMFQSDAGYAVLGSGNVTKVDILLKRASEATASASAPAQNLRGMYSYMADAGWFVDCRSGVRLAVAQEGDNAALEAAYSKDQSMPGAPLLATVEGRVEDRMPMEGPGPRPTLIVEKFISIAIRRLFRTLLQRAAPEHLLEAHDAEQRFRRIARRHA